MIRSSRVKLKFANRGKLKTAFALLSDQTNQVVTDLINDLINNHDKIPALLPAAVTNQLPFGARINQLLAKEASSVARSVRSKLSKAAGRHNLQKYQQELVDKFNARTLNVAWTGNLNLDSRFVGIEQSQNSTEFDLWLNIKFPGVDRVLLPFKSTRHMRDLFSRGYELKTQSCKICRDNTVILFFEKQPQPNTNSHAIGIDVGRNKSFVTSDRVIEHTTKSILNALPKKQHGSKSKARAVRRLHQTIDREIKSIDFANLSLVVMEDLTGMKPGSRRGNINHHWSYRYIQTRIAQRCEEHDVRVRHVNPAYTSQTCSACGVTDKTSRKKESFVCNSCGVVEDADFNASINILHRGTNNAHARKTSNSLLLNL